MAQSSIQQLIINSPHEEPSSYWAYHGKVRFFTQEKGRGPTGYVTTTPGAKSFDDPGVFRELPLVNFIRRRVAEWRKANYPGVTAITRRLLEHWQDLEQRDYRRFFFCQLEAIETLIWLIEASPEAREGIALPGRRRPVRATVLQDGDRVGQEDRDGHAGGLACAQQGHGSGRSAVLEERVHRGSGNHGADSSASARARQSGQSIPGRWRISWRSTTVLAVRSVATLHGLRACGRLAVHRLTPVTTTQRHAARA